MAAMKEEEEVNRISVEILTLTQQVLGVGEVGEMVT